MCAHSIVQYRADKYQDAVENDELVLLHAQFVRKKNEYLLTYDDFLLTKIYCTSEIYILFLEVRPPFYHGHHRLF